MENEGLEVEIERKFPLRLQLQRLEEVRCGLYLPPKPVSIWKRIGTTLLMPVKRLGD